jgi:predicted kinase
MDTSLEECIKRDKIREKSVWEQVILWMINHNITIDSH